MKRNNLFTFATSELSQDAFICWLLSFAHQDHINEDHTLTKCAKELLRKIVNTEDDLFVTKLKKQYKNIDVFLQVNDKFNIIIEDKTFTHQHGNQIDRYKQTLIDEGLTEIICVYYKIVEQSREEITDVNITRKDLLELFSKYKDETDNSIFLDYYDHLLAIDEDVMGYQNAPIEKWRDEYRHAYKGFFDHLIKDKIVKLNKDYGWGYVSNQSKGFWGFWWFYLSDEELKACNLEQYLIDALYIQIEDNIIAIKIRGSHDITQEIRWSLHNYFKNKIPDLKKKTFRKGKCMTLGYIEYNEKNYREKINQMEEAMNSITNGGYVFNLSY
ncbi:PD-(D/E)XK nuclease family protein [Acetobacterium wieringae]|uniref:PD-(D/E)XK nuclease family protein n=1 Tax=Acetobacterium wieringae TaxID=52694 RepID=UPI0026EB6C52|nr:PD-(D/E)XK nuclease family protein [Acetobacterium wieringae]